MRTASISSSNGKISKILETEYGGGALQPSYHTSVVYKLSNITSGTKINISGLADVNLYGILTCRVLY